MITPYPAVDALLEALVTGADAILGPHLVGFYLDGSLAIGDFDPRSSDIDFVAVVGAAMSDGEFAALQSLHAGLASAHPRWGPELEGSYWVIHRHVLRKHGVSLLGPAPRTLIEPVAPDDLRAAVVGILREWWRPMLEDPARLHTLEHGTIVTKPVAARWARASLDPRWQPLIERALAWSRDTPPDVDETRSVIQQTCREAGL